MFGWFWLICPGFKFHKWKRKWNNQWRQCQQQQCSFEIVEWWKYIVLVCFNQFIYFRLPSLQTRMFCHFSSLHFIFEQLFIWANSCVPFGARCMHLMKLIKFNWEISCDRWKSIKRKSNKYLLTRLSNLNGKVAQSKDENVIWLTAHTLSKCVWVFSFTEIFMLWFSKWKLCAEVEIFWHIYAKKKRAIIE